MAKMIWQSAGGTFRLLDKRLDLPRPLLELVHNVESIAGGRAGGAAIHMTPEDVDELWQALTMWLHELPDGSWKASQATTGILEVVRKERAQLEREFADRLSKLEERERGEILLPSCCPWCTHNVELHVPVDVHRATDMGRPSKRCAVAGCSCIIMGQEAPRPEPATS